MNRQHPQVTEGREGKGTRGHREVSCGSQQEISGGSAFRNVDERFCLGGAGLRCVLDAQRVMWGMCKITHTREVGWHRPLARSQCMSRTGSLGLGWDPWGERNPCQGAKNWGLDQCTGLQPGNSGGLGSHPEE